MAITASALGPAASGAQAQTFPETIAGSWSSPNCTNSERVMVINPGGILEFLPLGTSTFVRFSGFAEVPVTEAGGTIRAIRVSPNEQERTPVTFRIIEGKLNGTMERCQQVPASIRWLYGEAIAGFQLLGQALGTFRTQGSGPAIEAVFNGLDVSQDRALSEGEVARLLRILGFFGGYFAQKTALVRSEDVMMPSVVIGLFGPLTAATLIGNLDYDDDGRLSMAELLQDRGEGVELEAAAAALQPAAVQQLLQSLVASVPGLLPVIRSLR